MTGKLEWLNVSTAMWSRWTEAESMFLDLSEEVSFTSTEGRDICIHEIDHSGSVLLSSVDREPRPLMGYGDTAVYVTIDFASGWDQELSGPVHTPIRVDGVETLRLNLRVPRGNQALTSVDYMVAVTLTASSSACRSTASRALERGPALRGGASAAGGRGSGAFGARGGARRVVRVEEAA